jgi:hypothetical protein
MNKLIPIALTSAAIVLGAVAHATSEVAGNLNDGVYYQSKEPLPITDANFRGGGGFGGGDRRGFDFGGGDRRGFEFGGRPGLAIGASWLAGFTIGAFVFQSNVAYGSFECVAYDNYLGYPHPGFSGFDVNEAARNARRACFDSSPYVTDCQIPVSPRYYCGRRGYY